MFVVILPVIVPFFLDRGLTMHQVFQLQAIFGLGVVLLEIPTGYLSDMIGRKKTLVVGAFISGIAFTYLSFAQNFWQLVIFELTLSLALSLVSGADISLLYDSVDKSHRKHGTISLANLQLASVSGESVASVLGGILIAWSFQHVLFANAIVGWVPFLIALTVKEVPYEKMKTESHWKNFLGVYRHIFHSHDPILLLSFVNLTVWGLSTFFAVWMAQKYWQENNVPLMYFGTIWAIFNLSVGLMGKQVHSIEQRFGPLPLLIFIGFAPVIAYLGMGFLGGFVGVGMGLFFYLSRGINSVLLKDAMNWRTPSAFRATANSLQSFFFRLGFAICGPGVGFLIDRMGMRFTLKFLGFTFFVIFFLTMIPLIREIRRAAPRFIPEK
jgi:MFS family permease